MRIRRNQLFLVLIDIVIISAAFFLAYFFRYGTRTLDFINHKYLHAILIATPIFLVYYIVFSYYNAIWRHAGFREYLFGIIANILAGGTFLIIMIFDRMIFLPMVVLATILTLAGTMGVRISGRSFSYLQAWIRAKRDNNQRVMVIGAGEGGAIAISDMRKNSAAKLYPVCAIDDDPRKKNTYISGVPVVGGTDSIVSMTEEMEIDTILIAIPSLTRERKREILDICKKTDCAVKIMPSLYDEHLNNGNGKSIRDIRPEELLGRKEVELDEEKLKESFAGKTVLVTGGAGSVGSSICANILKYSPKMLVIADFNDSKLSKSCEEISSLNPDVKVKCLLASVKDSNNMNNLFMSYRPDIVFHCAAHNQVGFMEESIGETVRNNVFGTLNVAQAANKYKTEKFIFVSSDKAANPVNIFGATKRIGEMLVQAMNKTSETKFSSVRFGNIIQDTVDYLRRFKDELENGGPLTLENRELTRYFMTMNEVSGLILQSAAIAGGGEVFILDMGKPVRMYDLARDYIRLSGYDPETEIGIEITGGEIAGDVHEEVLTDPEGVNPSDHPRISTGRSVFDNLPELTGKLDDLNMVLDKGSNELIADQVVQTVKELIPNFYYMAFEDVLPSEAELMRRSLSGKDGKRIFLSPPHMGGMERLFVEQAFDTNWVAPLGPNVDEFEKEIQRYCDVTAAAAMTTGTAAIHMALRGLGVSQGDVVFCSSLTFSGSCNPIMYQGALPVFIDSERESWNMSPYALKKAMKVYTENGKPPKAVIVVNLYGQSANYDEICKICDEYGVPIIEDAAESLGAKYKGRYTGTIGKYGIFSFNGNKIITTSGGGMIVSNDEAAIRKVKFSITQARDQARHYQHSELGFNYRMSNVLAGIGRGQLKVLNLRVQQKKDIYEFYRKAFIDIPDIEMMPIADFGTPNYWLSVITIKETSSVKPLDVLIALEKEFIEARPVWKPMHLQPYFMKYDFYNHNDEGMSVSEDLFNRGVCLPSGTQMAEYDLMKVARIVRGCWKEKTGNA